MIKLMSIVLNDYLMLHPTLHVHAQYEVEGSYLATVMEGMFITLPTALDVRPCIMTNGHLCMFNQALYPVECTNWCIYALFINDKDQIERNCLLRTINQTTNLSYSLDEYLWAISALVTEKLQIRCIMETHVVTITPPLQIVDIGNGWEAYSSNIYIPAKSELITTLQSLTRSQFFLDYNFNYTNVSNFLVWFKTDFAKLTQEEIETLKAKILKLPSMSMELFDSVLEDINENYPLSLSPKLILALLIIVGICIIAMGIVFLWYKKKTSLASFMVGNLIKLVPSLIEKTPTLNSLLPILSELTPSQNNENAITPVTVSQLSQTPLDELILPPITVPKLHMENEKPSTSINILLQMELTSSHSTTIMTGPLSLEMFNHAATNLNDKGVINLKKYSKYLYRKSKPI